MHKLLIAAAAFAALSAGVAAAQTDQGQNRGQAVFAAADTNHDGVLSRAEFDAARAARFAQLDANHDGSLSADERPHRPDGQGAQDSAPMSRADYDAQGGRMFQRLDTDGNGSISQAEMDAMQAMHPPH